MKINPLDWIYDLETYPTVFTADFKHAKTGTRMFFEISFRRDDLDDLLQFLAALKEAQCRLVGYNNIGFDYPIIHFIWLNAHFHPTVDEIYKKAQSIIDTPWERRWGNVVWDNDVHIQQIDLYKIHHFDNDARRTSLKMLEFNMRMGSVEDLPFPPGTVLNTVQADILIDYNDHDIEATENFYLESLEMIKFREELSKKHGRNFLNHSDKKIGTDLFVNALEENQPGSCYGYNLDNKRVVRQTIRESIALKDVILPYIEFKNSEFQRIKNYLSSQVITETKGVFKDLNCTINGFKYVFGAGGIHGSVDSTIIQSDDDYVIVDWDVGGYYPSLGNVNNLYPEHLSNQFCAVDQELAAERKKHKKGTALNNAIKLARNGAYGDSNNKYSPFYDSKYTMSITINGQLLLCMLAQYLTDIPGLTMIQINTDGLTVRCPHKHVDAMNKICKWWEDYTKLELENVEYSRMFIRDVNNYIGEYKDGKLKSKGCYVHKTKQSQGPSWTPNDMDWHQNMSALVIPKAAEAALVHGQCIRDFITNHDNIFDFMLRTKVGRADKLVLCDTTGHEVQLQNITRYYIGADGGSLVKISQPAKGYKVGAWKRATKLTDQFYNETVNNLKSHTYTNHSPDELDTNDLPWDERINTKNRSKYVIRRTGFNVGWLVAPCNNVKDFDRDNIDYEYYIKETEKLVKPLRGE